MPKKKGGKGGNTRRRGKNDQFGFKRELLYKDEGQEYAQCLRMLGNGRLEAQCFDGQKRMAHIRGKMQKKVWINVGDIILLSLREYQDDKADVIHKFSSDEARQLKQEGELPDSAIINEGDDQQQANNDGITFGEASSMEQQNDNSVRPQQLVSSSDESSGDELDIDDI